VVFIPVGIMSKTVISVENLTKRYQLGVINSETLAKDLNRRWARWRGNPDPYIKIGQEDLSNRRGDMIMALDDVSFTMQQGEALGIIGKNGAGKSTLLKILSQITTPTRGRIKVKGRIGSLLEVGTGFHSELTGRENVYLNGAILGMTRAEVDRKFDEIVDFSGVEDFIDTPVKRYSSGMKVRLGFAVAAHLDPEILIVDEVLAVGDAEFRNKCMGKMGDVTEEGRTVLFVSHNMTMISTLCENTILLENGKLSKYSNTEEVIRYYQATSKNNLNTMLNDRFEDKLSKPVLYTNVRLLNSEKKPVNSVEMGEDVIVQLDFLANQQISMPNFTVRLYNQLKQNLVTWESRTTTGELPPISRGGSVFLHIKSLNLLPGIYNLDLVISDRYQTFDSIKDAFTFEIYPTGFFTTGKLSKSNRGLIFTPCDWEVSYD